MEEGYWEGGEMEGGYWEDGYWDDAADQWIETDEFWVEEHWVDEYWVEPHYVEETWEDGSWEGQDYEQIYERFEVLGYPWAVDYCMPWYKYDATFDYYETYDYDHDHETTIENYLCIVERLKHTHGFTEQPADWIPMAERIVKTYGFDPPAWMIADYTKD